MLAKVHYFHFFAYQFWQHFLGEGHPSKEPRLSAPPKELEKLPVAPSNRLVDGRQMVTAKHKASGSPFSEPLALHWAI
jgi:hypothetical protein